MITEYWETSIFTGSVAEASLEAASLQDVADGAVRSFAETIGPTVSAADRCFEQTINVGPLEGVTLGPQYGDCTVVVVTAARGEADGLAGSVLIHDPRAAAGMASVPGAPWGRPHTVEPKVGDLVVFPSWAAWTVVPLAANQHVSLHVAAFELAETSVSGA